MGQIKVKSKTKNQTSKRKLNVKTRDFAFINLKCYNFANWR